MDRSYKESLEFTKVAQQPPKRRSNSSKNLDFDDLIEQTLDANTVSKPKLDTNSVNQREEKQTHSRAAKSLVIQKTIDGCSRINCQVTDSDTILVKGLSKLSPQVMDKIKFEGGNYNKDLRGWTFTFKKYINLVKVLNNPFYNCEVQPVPAMAFDAMRLNSFDRLTFKIQTEKVIIDYSKDSLPDPLPESLESKLYPFQREGIMFAIRKRGRILLADEMGVGKTIQAIGVSIAFKKDWPVLIVCPSSLKLNWKKEILEWLPEAVKKDEIQVVKSSSEDFDNGKKFYIMSYDLSFRLGDKLKKKDFQFIIADEAHYVKSREAKRSKFLIPIFKKAKRLLLLTGTPILSMPIEVWNILNCLRPDIFSVFNHYASRYCDPKNSNLLKRRVRRAVQRSRQHTGTQFYPQKCYDKAFEEGRVEGLAT